MKNSKYLTSVLLFTVFAAPYANANSFDKKTISMKFNNNQCVDIFGGANGNPYSNYQQVGTYQCHNGVTQRFNYIDGQVKTSINTYGDRDSNTDYCLDIAGNNDWSGTEVRLWDCNNTSAQKFKLRQEPNSKYYLQSQNGYCVSFTSSGSYLDTCNPSWDTTQSFNPFNIKSMIKVRYYNDGAFNFTPKIEANGNVFYSNNYSISWDRGWHRWVSGDITRLFIGGWPATVHGQLSKTINTKPGSNYVLESKGSAFNPYISVYEEF